MFSPSCSRIRRFLGNITALLLLEGEFMITEASKYAINGKYSDHLLIGKCVLADLN